MSDNFHVYPRADLIKHELVGDECVCGPTANPFKREDGSIGWSIVHHALDSEYDNENVQVTYKKD